MYALHFEHLQKGMWKLVNEKRWFIEWTHIDIYNNDSHFWRVIVLPSWGRKRGKSYPCIFLPLLPTNLGVSVCWNPFGNLLHFVSYLKRGILLAIMIARSTSGASIHFIIGPHTHLGITFFGGASPQWKLADILRGDNKRGKVTEHEWAILAQEYIKFAIQKCLI